MFFSKINKEARITKELDKFELEYKSIKMVDKIPSPSYLWLDWSFGPASGEHEYSYEIEYIQDGKPNLLYCLFTTWLDIIVLRVRFFCKIDGKVKEIHYLGSLLKT